MDKIKKAEQLTDTRQEWKVWHKLPEVVMIALLSLLANVDEWELIGDFAHANEDFLRKHFRSCGQ